MGVSDRQHDTSHVADLLQRTFDAQPAEPLDPALIQLMLELSRAPDATMPVAAMPDAVISDGKSPPDPAREKPLLRFFAARWLRRIIQSESLAAD